ncbi:MAG: CaiB/BaiF CoA transferase family protein [Tepidiformaceae bacterium]
MSGPLDGVRVIDLSRGPAAGAATMVLADFGADVLKIEPPGGDPFRSLANAPVWLRGKRSVELDLAAEGALQSLAPLLDRADVLVSTLAPGAAKRFGVDYERLTARNPGLVYCHVSGFGNDGPYANYPGYEGVVAAKSGRMQAFAGLPSREGPAFAAVQVGTHACSQATAAGAIAALIARHETGRGQLVETSMLQAMLPYDLLGLLRVQLSRRDPEAWANDPFAAPGARMPTLNYHPLQAKDGKWLQMGNLLQHLFDNYVAAADLMDVYADPRYEGPPPTWAPDDLEAFRDRMIERMREHTADEWMQVFLEQGGVAATVYHSTQEALTDPDLIANGHIHEWDDPALGRVTGPGPVARLTTTPGQSEAPAPSIGQHTDALRNSPWEARPAPARPGRRLAGPLAGVTILEFATIIAAPLGVSLLADLGARVIKVEPIGGDPYRGMGMAGIMAAKTNQGKESIGVDLKSPEGVAIVHRLLEKTDVLIHNYRPGVPDRLGIGYEDAKRINPKIVYVSVNGYGPDGPSAHRPSTHPIPGAAIGGALHQAGAGFPPPYCDTIAEVRAGAQRLFRANEANPDPNTSVVVTTAALLGIYAQRLNGIGQEIFVDMLGANVYANLDDFVLYKGKQPRRVPDANLYGPSAVYRLYPANSGWVFLALLTDAEWQRFCDLTGASALAADPRFATAAGRATNDSALAEALTALFAQRDADEWETLLAPNGIGCVRADGPVPGEFWADDPHVRENGFVRSATHARYGEYLRFGPISTFSDTPVQYGPGVLGGEHTDALLRETGYDAEAIAGLWQRGVVWSEVARGN